MEALQLLDRQAQMGPPLAPRQRAGSAPDSFLGSKSIQLPLDASSELATKSAARPLPKIAFLRVRHFRPHGREERIARSLAALDRRTSIQLDSETWRWIAEDADLEYVRLE